MNIVIALSQCDWHDCHTSQYTAGTVKALSLFAADIMTTLLFAVYIPCRFLLRYKSFWRRNTGRANQKYPPTISCR